jgi:hypothetical protein
VAESFDDFADLEVKISAEGAKAGAAQFVSAIRDMSSASAAFAAHMTQMTGNAAKDFELMRSGAYSASNALGDLANKSKAATASLSTGINGARDSVLSLKTALVGLASSQVASSLVGTIATFEQLKTSLVTVEKSVDGASAKFKELQGFAKDTPFSVEESVKAYQRLASAGLKPTIAEMRVYGDLVAAKPGKDMLQFSEALADSLRGEFVRMKEFDIGMSKHGDNVKLVYGDMALEVKNSSSEIEAALQKISKANFAGGMERQSKTLAGQWSTLKDSAANLAMEIGEAGLLDAMKGVVSEMTSATSGSSSMAHEIGSVLGEAVRGTAASAKFLVDHLSELGAVLTGVMAYSATSWFVAAAASAGSFSSMMGVATMSVGAFGTAMYAATVANPFFWVAAGIAGFVEIIAHWDYISDAVSNWTPPTWAEGNKPSAERAASMQESFGTDQHGTAYYEHYGEVIEDAGNKIEITAAQQAAFNDLVNKGITFVNDYKAALDRQAEATAANVKYIEQYGVASFAVKELGDKISSTASVAATAVGPMGDFVDSIIGQDGATAGKIKQVSGEVGGFLSGLGASFASVGGTIKDAVVTELGKASGTTKDLADHTKNFHDESDAALLAWLEIPKSIRDANAALSELNGPQKPGSAYTGSQADKSTSDLLGLRDSVSNMPDLIGNLQKDLGSAGGASIADYFVEGEEQAKASAANISNVDTDLLKSMEAAEAASLERRKQMMADWGSFASDAVGKFSDTFIAALNGQEHAWRDFVIQLTAQAAQLALTQGFSEGGSLSGLFKGGGVSAAVHHSGGIVGSGGSYRSVSPSVFMGATRYHTGGYAGLKPDEIPAILQRGERVQSKREVAQGGLSGRGNRHYAININLHGVSDGNSLNRSLPMLTRRLRQIVRDDNE